MANVGRDLLNWINDVAGQSQGDAYTEAAQSLEGDKKEAPKKEPKKKAKDEKPKATNATKEPDPWTQLSEQLVGQLQQEQRVSEAAISGALMGPAAATATNIADQALGVTSSSPTGQWLQGLQNTAQQQTDPLSQALAAYGTAYGASNAGVDQALIDVGKANDASINTAAEQPYLQAGAQHLLTTGSGYYNLPPGMQKDLPPYVAQLLQNLQVGGITTPKGGWGPDALPTTGSSGLATALAGTTPGAAGSTNNFNSVTSSGNASQPGS